jgi:hypothetical protein
VKNQSIHHAASIFFKKLISYIDEKYNMKFCSGCGSELPNITVNFCPTFGAKLWKKESTDVVSEEKIQSRNTIYSLGIKLEPMFDKILKAKGFDTIRRKKLEGKSGTFHEIDILATKNEIVLAVECKNYGETRTIGLKCITDKIYFLISKKRIIIYILGKLMI